MDSKYQLPDLETWLGSTGLSQYIPNFKNQDITITEIFSLTAVETDALGIATLGHKKRFIEAREQLLNSIKAVYQKEHLLKSQNLTKKLIYIVSAIGIIISAIAFFTAKNPEDGFLGNYFTSGLVVTVGCLVFLIPSIIAGWRGHEYAWAILLANIFLGGTGLIWAVCLVMALGKINPGTAAVLAFLGQQNRR
jgi:Superinfection immunity protein/SAM domain (Sterile alpha motif)